MKRTLHEQRKARLARINEAASKFRQAQTFATNVRVKGGTIVVPVRKPKPIFEFRYRLVYAAPIGPIKDPKRPVPCLTDYEIAKRILRVVSNRHQVSQVDVCSERRQEAFVHARQEAMWMIKNATSWSLPRIGRFLGGRDHTTVLHGIRAHAKRLKDGTEAVAQSQAVLASMALELRRAP